MAAQPDEIWTVGRLIKATQDYLKKKGAESPRLDAEVLLASVLSCRRVELYTQYESVVGDRDRSKYRDLVRRRSEGAPVAYLVGKKEFYSLELAVSPAVLIPRPDTENVVVEALARLKEVARPRAVDVGTGSGALALACAQHVKALKVIAIDISPEALAVARANAGTLGLADRVEFREGDLLAPVLDEEPFDAILSNPPYIPTATIATLEPGVADHEPHLALDGGPDGLRVVDRLIAGAVDRLKPGGCLILEIGSDQEAAVRALIAARAEYDLGPTVRDASNHPRVIIATRKAAENAG